MKTGTKTAESRRTTRERRSSGLGLGIAVMLVGLGGQSSGQEKGDWESELGRRAEAAVPKLEAHAAWSQREKLFRERDRTWETILLLDPGHAAARKALRYRKDRAGGWRQSSSYREPRNRNREMLAECLERRQAALEPYVAMLLGRLEDAGSCSAADLPAWIPGRLLALAPDDARVRAALGEEWDPALEGWTLSETIRASERRSRLEALARALLDDGIRPEESAPTEFESGLGLPWNAVLETENVRVLGTGDPEETRRSGILAEATIRLLHEVFGWGPRPSPYVLYLLQDDAEQARMLDAHPGLADVDAVAAVGRTGIWVPLGNQLILWEASPERLHQTVIEQSVAWILSRAFGLGSAEGWAFEGVSVYLTLALLGHDTRIDSGEQAHTGEDVAVASRRCWGHVRQIAIPDGEVEPTSFFRPATEEVEERLRGSLMVRYLIESRPGDLVLILRHMDAESPPDQVVNEVLGEDLQALLGRMLRWTRETESRGEREEPARP